MTKIRARKFVELKSGALVLLAIAWFATVGSAWARANKSKRPRREAQVVAHISFGALSEVDMSMPSAENHKRYLYVQHAKDEGISVIDIGRPDEPRVIGEIPGPDSPLSGTTKLEGNLAIVDESESPRRDGDPHIEDIAFSDMSKPSAPRMLQKFSGVVRWLSDDRNFVYILNGDGLWVVSKPHRAPEQMDFSESPDSSG